MRMRSRALLFFRARPGDGLREHARPRPAGVGRPAHRPSKAMPRVEAYPTVMQNHGIVVANQLAQNGTGSRPVHRGRHRLLRRATRCHRSAAATPPGRRRRGWPSGFFGVLREKTIGVPSLHDREATGKKSCSGHEAPSWGAASCAEARRASPYPGHPPGEIPLSADCCSWRRQIQVTLPRRCGSVGRREGRPNFPLPPPSGGEDRALCFHQSSPTTRYAGTGAEKPFKSSIPSGSARTSGSTCARLFPLMRISPAAASPHRRAARLVTLPMAA